MHFFPCSFIFLVVFTSSLNFFKVAGTIVCPSDVDIGMYTGNISITNGGRTCLNWTDGVGALIKSDKNYCRNKIRNDQTDPTPWCFTSTYGEWQYCYEQICKGKFGLVVARLLHCCFTSTVNI